MKYKSLSEKQDFWDTSRIQYRLFKDLLNISVADKTVELRAEYGLRTPDAIQLATAVSCGSDYVLTNDRKWKQVNQCNTVLLDEL